MDGVRLNFGEWLDDLLQSAGYNQTTAAEALDLSQAAVSAWINNVQPPSKRNVRAIARLLGVEASDIEARIDRKKKGGAIRERGGVRATEAIVTLKVSGIVPADAIRWTEVDEERESVDVPLSWLRGRSEEDVFVVEVSGDCLRSHGIIDGDLLLCERARRMPRNGDIVIVRVGGDVTLKLWFWSDAGIELRDGNGAVIHRLSPTDDFHVEGFRLKLIRDDDANDATGR